MNYPFFLLLLLLPLLFFVYKGRKFFLTHAYVSALSLTGGKSKFRLNYKFLNWLAFFFLILAASDISWSITEVVETHLVHKYILINDASGSMVDFMQKNGIGREMQALLDGNKKFLLGLKDGKRKDYVGAIVFSSNAFVVSDLVDDPEFVLKKILRIDYSINPLAGGTNIKSAIWTGILMALGEKKNDKLEVRMYGDENRLIEDDYLKGLASSKQKEVQGTSLIVFTDGFLPNPAGSNFDMSMFKLMNFCEMIGIRIFLISVSTMEINIASSIKKTGGSIIVTNDINSSKLTKVYKDILDSQANEMIEVEQESDKSLSQLLAFVALIFLFLGIVLQNTFNRNFTEV